MSFFTKRILSMALALCLCLAMLPTVAMKAGAATPGYIVSAAYKESSYYSALCNVTLTGNQRTDIVNVALSQVGYREGSYSGDYGGVDDGSYNNYTEYNYWYHNYVSSGMPVGGADTAPWCATFVSWCAEQANIPTSILKRSTAAGHGASYFNVNFYSGSSSLASSGDNDSYFKGYNYTPKAGDLFFTRSWSHVGIVVAVNGSYVITVEGNTNTNGGSQGNGVYRLTSRRIADLYFGVPNYTSTSIKHIVDSSYGTNFTAYPKAKITAENIFDVYHNQIDSTSWIGVTDQCIIHEVYTDGCCKVTYPLDAGGTKTVYGKISLFNTHTHSYTGTRVYESAHPHRISQRCVDYATCGGYIWTDEYYELKTCEQCWYATFKIGASSISVKVDESKTVSSTVSGCLPNSAVLYQTFSPDNDVVGVTIKNQQATFTGLKAGTTDFSLIVYSDSSKSHVIGSITIPVTVTVQTYTVSYNANGGNGAPSSQTKSHGTSLALSSTVPTRFGYNFAGWATSSTATSAKYQPGDSFTTDANTNLYAVWSSAETISTSTEAIKSPVSEHGKSGYYYKLIPSVSSSYSVNICDILEEGMVSITLYDNNGNKLQSVRGDDSTVFSEYDCTLEYNVTAGKSYFLYAEYTDTDKDGVYLIISRGYLISYDANGGTDKPSSEYHYYASGPYRISSEVPTRKGYTFTAWNTMADGSGNSYSSGDYLDEGWGDYVLYAIWQKGCSGIHNYKYAVTKTPTTGVAGTIKGTCSDCGGTTTVTLPKLSTTDYTYSEETGIGRYTWKNTTYGVFYFEVVPVAPPLFDIPGISMSLGNSLAMYYYVPAANITDGCYTQITKGDKAVEVPFAGCAKQVISGVEYYIVPFDGIAAKEMTEELTCVVYNKDGTAISTPKTTSVETYALKQLETTTDARLRTVLVDMLNYGAAAQEQFQYNTAVPANARLTDGQKGCATGSIDISALNSAAVKGNGWKGCSLTLESNIQLAVFFNSTVVTKDMTAKISYTDHYGKAVSYDIPGSSFGTFDASTLYVSVETLAAADLETVVSIDIMSGDTLVSHNECNMARYCTQAATDPMVIALAKYCQAANTYFHP